MVGLLSRGALGEAEGEAPGPSIAAQGDEMGEAQEEGPEANVSPEEQAVYDRFMNEAYKMVYGKDRWPTVLRQISSAPDKPDALATMVSMVALRIATAAKKAQSPISGDVLLAGASELMETMAEDFEKFGAATFSTADLETALYRGMDKFREAAQQSGLLTMEDADADVRMLAEADQNGQLGAVFSALQAKSGGRPSPQPQQGAGAPRQAE